MLTEGLDLRDANGLFFCVLKICRTPRCLLEADKPVETRRGLYSPIIPCFLKACIKLHERATLCRLETRHRFFLSIDSWISVFAYLPVPPQWMPY